MKKDISIEESTENVEIFDTAVAIMAGLMIIPAVFAFSGGNAETLKSGPALMFITIPKVFANMGLGTAIGIVFFLLVLFAAVTSSIALTESAVSTFEDELHWSRRKSTVFMGVIMILLGTLSCLGYGPLADFKILGMQFLDFFDFMTNSVMMPIAAIATCLLVSKVVGVDKLEKEITKDGQPFRRKKIFCFMIKNIFVRFFCSNHFDQFCCKCIWYYYNVKRMADAILFSFIFYASSIALPISFLLYLFAKSIHSVAL